MTLLLRALAVATALAALSACASVDERPAVCRLARGPDGMGGTGATTDVLTRLVAADRGMGGTGVSGADNRGMGGTGVVARNGDRGMGGSGIIGVVTGFGSICVNGYEIALADTTKVTIENLPAAAGDIRLGHVVEVEAFKDKGQLTALAVNVRVAVAGPVESVTPDGVTAVIAGQTVRSTALAPRWDFARLKAGDWVAVSGLRRGDDVVVATSLAVLPEAGPQAGRDVLVAGPVRIDAEGRRRIGGMALADSKLADTKLTEGQNAVARGAVMGATLVTGTVLAELPPEFTTRVANLSVAGFATALDSSQIRIGTITAGIAQSTLAGVLRTDLGGQVVQLEGSFGALGVTGGVAGGVAGGLAGVLAPERIFVPDRPQDGSVFTFTPGGINQGGSVITIAPGRVDPTPVRPDLVPGTVGGTPQSPPTRPDMSGATLRP